MYVMQFLVPQDIIKAKKLQGNCAEEPDSLVEALKPELFLLIDSLMTISEHHSSFGNELNCRRGGCC